MTLVHMKPCVGGVKRTQTTILKMHLIPGWIHAREQYYTTVLLWLAVTLTHVYFHLWTTDIKKNGLWWPKHVLSFSNNHNISDLHSTVFPNISSYRSEYNSQSDILHNKSLLGNQILYNSWVHVLHITYFWSPTIIYWKPSVTYHFDLFIINKDDKQHVF